MPDHTTVRDNRVRYWHGGPSGLAVGAHILPPTAAGVRERGGDRVYVTTARSLAFAYAAKCESVGAVYEVVPILDPRTTPWYEGGGSWSCDRARILSVRVIGPETQDHVREMYRLWQASR
jgi:hypothetical protein